jgi:hypothetical protein
MCENQQVTESVTQSPRRDGPARRRRQWAGVIAYHLAAAEVCPRGLCYIGPDTLPPS